MPVLQARTISSELVWSSPDKQKSIWKVGLEVDGQRVLAKTYSKAISQIGWSGTVESYTKDGKSGPEVFVKQPQQERGNFQRGGKPSGDNFTMYLSYAKDLAVALITSGQKLDELPSLIETVALEGKHLYSLREGAPEQQTEPTYTPVDDIENTDIKSEMDKLFPEEDDSWKKNNPLMDI